MSSTIWRNGGLLFLAFIIQGSFGEHLAIKGIRPDFVVTILVYVALASGSFTGIVLGFSVGLLQDIYGPPASLGLNALSKSIIGYLVGLGRAGLYRESFVTLGLVLGVALLIHDGLYTLIGAQGDVGVFLQRFWSISCPTIVYTLAFGLFLAILLVYREGQFHARRLFP